MYVANFLNNTITIYDKNNNLFCLNGGKITDNTSQYYNKYLINKINIETFEVIPFCSDNLDTPSTQIKI
jgi:hypothetical protein